MASDRALAIRLKAFLGEFLGPMETAKDVVKDFGATSKASLGEAAAASSTAEKAIGGAGNAISGSMTKAAGAVTAFGARVKEEFGAIGEHAVKLNDLYGSLISAFIGAEVVKGLADWVVGADKFRDSLEQSANTAKNMGHAFDADALGESLKRLSLSSQGGGYGLNEMAEAAQRFAAMGATREQIDYLEVSTARLAAATGETFPEAANQMAMGAAGLERGMRRLGLETKNSDGSLRSFGSMLDELNSRYVGAAEKRTASLEGALGVLGNHFTILSNTLATNLAPAFEQVVGALDAIVVAFTNLSPALQQTIALGAAGALGIAALGLAFQVSSTLMAAAGEAVGLFIRPLGLAVEGVSAFGGVALRALAPIGGAVASATAAFGRLLLEGVTPLYRALIGPVISGAEKAGAAIAGFCANMIGRIAAVAAAWVAEGVAAASAAFATLGPIAAIIAAIALIAVAVWQVIAHWGDFREAAGKALNAVGDAIKSFVSFVGDQFRGLAQIFAGAWAYLTGNESGGLAQMQSGLSAVAKGWQGVGNAIKEHVTAGAKAGLDYIQQHYPQTLAAIKSMLSGGAPASFGGGGKVDLAGLGNAPGENKGAVDSAASNALDNLFSAVADRVAKAQDHLEDTKVGVRSAQQSVTSYESSLPPEAQRSAAQTAELQRREREQQAEINAERAATVALAQAQAQAEADIRSAAASISPHLKNHDELLRSCNEKAREYRRAMQQTRGDAIDLRIEIDKIAHSIQAQTAEQLKAADAAAARRAGEQRTAVDSFFESQSSTTNDAIEGIERQRSVQSARGGLSPVQDAQFNAQIAALKEQLAEEALARARANEALDQATLSVLKTAEAQDEYRKKIVDDAKAIDAATKALANAQTGSTVAGIQLQSQQQAVSLLGRIENLLVSKASELGLKEKPGGGISFDPLSLLMNAFSKTQAFADIMQVVNQIMQVFAQVLNGLRPVIDALLAVVRAIVNVFIDVYNVFAQLLRLIGIHIPLLNQLNSATQVQLIEVTHLLPTLNELAAGKLKSPLSPTPVGANSTQQLKNAIENPTGVMSGIQNVIGAVGLVVAGIWISHMLQQMHTRTMVATVQASTDAIVTAVTSSGGGGGLFGGLFGGGGGGGIGVLGWVGLGLTALSLLTSHSGGGGYSDSGSSSGTQQTTLIQLNQGITKLTTATNNLTAATGSAVDAMSSNMVAASQGAQQALAAALSGAGGKSVSVTAPIAVSTGSAASGVDAVSLGQTLADIIIKRTRTAAYAVNR